MGLNDVEFIEPFARVKSGCEIWSRLKRVRTQMLDRP
jgi:hypothetical protein